MRKSNMPVDFLFAFLIFSFIFYFIFDNNFNKQEAKKQEIFLDEIQKDLEDICFLLSNTQGSPINFNQISKSQILQIGLLNSSKSIDVSKINFLENNYTDLLDIFEIDFVLGIQIFYLENGNTIFEKNFYESFNRVRSSNCFSKLNGNIIQISLKGGN